MLYSRNSKKEDKKLRSLCAVQQKLNSRKQEAEVLVSYRET
jgi:hypothetical protein